MVWTCSKGCDGTAWGTECAVCANHTHQEPAGDQSKGLSMGSPVPWGEVAAALVGWPPQIPAAGSGPSPDGCSVSGSRSVLWSESGIWDLLIPPARPSPAVRVVLLVQWCCICSLPAGASMERSLASPVREPGCLLCLQVQTLCIVSVLFAFGSQRAAGPDAWESSPAYLSLYFSLGVELARKHWGLERWFPLYTHPWLWFSNGKDLWSCLFSLASLQYITEPNFVSNKKYSTGLLFGEFCAWGGLVHPGSLTGKEAFRGFDGKISSIHNDQGRTVHHKLG